MQTVPAIPTSTASGFDGSINVPRARDRMLEFFEREQVPDGVRSTLAAGLNGDLHYQSLLFIAMMDTWPKLQKNINEIARLVSIAPWKVIPASKRGKKPEPAAEDLAEEVEDIIWNMRPRAERRENGLEGTIEQHAVGYYFGHSVSQIRWERDFDGMWKPRATKSLTARYYGYPYDSLAGEDPEDRLMLDKEGGTGSRTFEDFPDHQFLIGINCGHPGHPAVAAPLRALAAYWLAAVYGLKWFVNFTQLYGIPWRHAEVADPADENAVANALAGIGSRGFIVTKPGTKINILDSPSTSLSLPQKELLDVADKQCDVFILGQTLSSGTDSSGSRALGEIHEKTKQDMVDAVADHVGRILTHQLVPSIVAVNWGEGRTDLPQIWARREESKDEKAEAERMKIILSLGIPIAEADVYDALGIKQPAADAKLFQPVANGVPGDPAPGNGQPHETKTGLETPLEVAAADAADWRRFPASSGSLNIPRAEMPQIASGNRAALVNFLRARGIPSAAEEVHADTLKPTQAEFSPAKVEAATNYKGGNRAILISSDDHVVDGHHQWLSAGTGKIKVIRLGAPIARVLMMAHRMPSTTVAAAEVEKSTIDELADNVAESVSGVARQWLSPVKPIFMRLAAMAASGNVTDEDFQAAVEKAHREMPEIFDRLDSDSLQKAFEESIASGLLAGSISRYDQNA